MNTPKDLIKATGEKIKQLATANADLEDYVIIIIAKLTSFAAGVAVGHWLL